MRFVAPDRAEFSRDVLRQPPLAQWLDPWGWLDAMQFPAVDELNRDWSERWRFVAQTPALLADGLHYESRIHERGQIATRADNWHDFFNALVWRRYPLLKAALNRRQIAEIALMGDKQRSRAQCALTHFDEGGVIVVLREAQLLNYWDAHDWTGLFWEARDAWKEGLIRAEVFGHALLEMALVPDKLITGKALVVVEADDGGPEAAIVALAAAIADGRLLNDPQELRALPVSGIPGWHRANGEASFYAAAECFRPLRTGRRYPPPLTLGVVD